MKKFTAENDKDVFTKIMINMEDDNDNSDWDDVDDDKIGSGLVMNRTPEPKSRKKLRHYTMDTMEDDNKRHSAKLHQK